MSVPSTDGGLVRPVLALSFPTMLANVLQSGFVLVDMWFVGRLGTDAIAAVSVSGVVMSVVFPFVIGLTVGSNALISRAHGSGDASELNRTIFSVLVFAASLSLVLTAAGTPLADEIIGLFHVEPRVHVQALGYLRIALGGISFMICLFLVNAVLRALGDAMTPFIILVVSTLVNFSLDPLLIFGAGPVPAMGVDGAAVASVAARAVGLVIAIVVLIRRTLPRPALSWSYLSGRIVWKIVTIGVPSSLSLMTRHVSGLVITFIVVAFGTEAVAAYGVCQRITFLVLMPGFGFAVASAVLTGQSLGAGDARRAEASTWIAVASYAILVTACAAVLFAAPGPIVALFDDTPAVVDLGRRFFLVNAPALLMLPLGLVLSRSMSGAGYTFWPMVVSVVVLLGIRVPMAWILSRHFGMDGIFWAVGVPVVIEGAAVALLFMRGGWKRQSVS